MSTWLACGVLALKWRNCDPKRAQIIAFMTGFSRAIQNFCRSRDGGDGDWNSCHDKDLRKKRSSPPKRQEMGFGIHPMSTGSPHGFSWWTRGRQGRRPGVHGLQHYDTESARRHGLALNVLDARSEPIHVPQRHGATSERARGSMNSLRLIGSSRAGQRFLPRFMCAALA